MTAGIVERLARLGEDELRNVIQQARAERRRRMQAAIRAARKTLLPGLSDRKAARAIHDAARHHRGKFDADLRAEIERQLVAELDYLDDLPGESRIRQLFD